MPKQNIDYSNTVMYKIVCKDLKIKDIYVGHTTDFRRRKSQHKNCCNKSINKNYNLKIYQFIRDNGGFDNFDVLLIEKYPCNDGDEARIRERYWYETLNADLNINKPYTTIEEVKQLKAKYDNTYYNKNIDKIKIYKQEYRLKNKEYLDEKNKLYREQHKDDKRLNDKLYKDNNKEKFHCECGGCYDNFHKSEHFKTKLHMNYEKNNLLYIEEC